MFFWVSKIIGKQSFIKIGSLGYVNYWLWNKLFSIFGRAVIENKIRTVQFFRLGAKIDEMIPKCAGYDASYFARNKNGQNLKMST